MRIGLVLIAALALTGCDDDSNTTDLAGPQDLSAIPQRDLTSTNFDLTGGPTDGGNVTADSGAPMSATVVVKNYEFLPATVTIAKGGTVTWMWMDGGHTVTSGPNRTVDGKFCSGLNGNQQPSLNNCAATTTSNAGTMFSVKFDTAGAFPYFCKPHPQMIATVNVQ